MPGETVLVTAAILAGQGTLASMASSAPRPRARSSATIAAIGSGGSSGFRSFTAMAHYVTWTSGG